MVRVPGLGRHGDDVPISSRVTKLEMPIAFPDHARQGDPEWYLIRLHFRITFAKDSTRGFADVSASTNGRTAALFEFVQHGVGSHRRFEWNSTNLLDGALHGAGTGASFTAGERNFLQIHGVRPGRGTLSFQLEQHQGIRVSRLHIYPDSQILITRDGPGTLTQRLMPPSNTLTAGSKASIGYRLIPHGRPQRVELQILAPPGIALLGPTTRRLGVLTKPVEGKLSIRPILTGSKQLTVVASGAAAQTATVWRFDVRSREQSTFPPGGITLWSLVVLALGMGGVLRSRLRSAKDPSRE